VRDAFEMTVHAFNFAELYRVPVILLMDEVLAHMRENIKWPEPGELKVVPRTVPADLKSYKPFNNSPFVPFGAGARFHVTGLAHGPEGFAVADEAAARELRRLIGKVQDHVLDLTMSDACMLDDAEIAFVSYGITSRPALAAVEMLRAQGVRAGALSLKTLWPFPEHLIQELAPRVEKIIVPELNMGQLVREIARAANGACQVIPVSRIDGHLLTPDQIMRAALTESHSKGALSS